MIPVPITELEPYVISNERNKKYKEVIDKVSSQIKLYGKYNGEKCTRGFSVMTADFNKLLDILNLRMQQLYDEANYLNNQE